MSLQDQSSLNAGLKYWDKDPYKSEDFLLNPICILYIIVCLCMLFYVQSIHICLNQNIAECSKGN